MKPHDNYGHAQEAQFQKDFTAGQSFVQKMLTSNIIITSADHSVTKLSS